MSKEYFRNEPIRLPDASTRARVAWGAQNLPTGCYRLRWDGVDGQCFEGSLRVHHDGDGLPFVSGDLYEIDALNDKGHCDATVPIYSRNRYRYYLQHSQIEPASIDDQFVSLSFELLARAKPQVDSAKSVWSTDPDGTYRVSLSSQGDGNLYGCVKRFEGNGDTVAFLRLAWVSSFLRTAKIEIDCEDGITPPTGTGASPQDWTAIGAAVDWQISAQIDDCTIPARKPRLPWTNAECHDAMSKWRSKDAELDREWRYHLLCVDSLMSGHRGVMYDVGASDSTAIVREGAAVSANWKFPVDSKWGYLQAKTSCSAPGPYFRTAVHEVGHAMSLFHDDVGVYLMRTTEAIADVAVKTSKQFPNNIGWSFSDADAMFLRHAPDPLVRPGGDMPSYDLDYGDDANPDPSNDLQLTVTPVLDTIPLGAPVRVELLLKHCGASGDEVLVPADIGLSGAHVRGEVFGPYPDGKSRSFRPLLIPGDGGKLQKLPLNSSVEGALTLLRGGEGALFPKPGKYEIEVALRWHDGKTPWIVVGKASVMVNPARSKADESAAESVRDARDLLLTLVIGGDHLREGIAAIKTAMKNRTLRPHYAGIEAKRRAALPGANLRQLTAAALLIDVRTVLSQQEREKVEHMFETRLTRLQEWRLGRCLREHKPLTVMGQAMNQMFDALLRSLIVIGQWMVGRWAFRS
ncbi:hypothetical protein [Nevskia sp.]|uniref:hypothetical protein n=1 Tax=Nevskia sp. TaxID=1929292 RepID=UPI003F726B1C